jgi:hypothetical protein
MPTYAKPIVGVDAIVILTPLPTTAVPSPTAFTLKNSKYSLSISNKIAEAPNTTDGMVRAPGLSDYKGSVEGFTDVTSSTTVIESSVVMGAMYAFKIYRSLASASYWSGTLIMGEDLKIDTGCDGGAESYSFSFAKAFGPLTSPSGVVVA